MKRILAGGNALKVLGLTRSVNGGAVRVFSVLLNHLIRSRQEVGRDREADLLSGFQVDNQLEFHRLLYRKISRLGPFQDFIYQNSGAPEGLGLVRSVRHQAAADNIISPSVYHRQPIFCRQVRDRLLIRNKQRAMRHGDSSATALSRLFERILVFVGPAYLDGMKLQTQFSCRQLAFFPLLRRAWILWIPQHRNAG
jgi:hypothetical protein